MLQFDVYIGQEMYSAQNEKVKAVVEPKFFIPTGQCDFQGNTLKKNPICFKSLYDLGTYFCDWFDIITKKNEIKVRVYLNIMSLSKTFIGEEIVDFLDALQKIDNYENIRSFKEIIGD